MVNDDAQVAERREPPEQRSADLRPNEALAARLRGFGPLGIVAILLVLFTGNIFFGQVIVPIGALLTLLWVHLSRTPWRDIGYVRPKNWAMTVGGGILFGVAFKLGMKTLVMPLLGADPINRAFSQWTHNTAVMPAAVWAMFVAGFAEETVFRGFLFERLGKLFGPSIWAKIAIVLLTSAWFGAAHYSVQGLAGTEQATIVGLVFGTMVAITGRIVVLMVAHTAFDLTALALIYWGIETRVAHFIFK